MDDKLYLCLEHFLLEVCSKILDYDKAFLAPKSPGAQRKLLPSFQPTRDGCSRSNNVMVQRAFADVFLCDKCDDEFASLRQVQEHERLCRGDGPSSASPSSPEQETSEDEPPLGEKLPFLAAFGLMPAEHTGVQPYKSPRRPVKSPAKTNYRNYFRYESVALSSLLGKHILSRFKPGSNVHHNHLVMKYEKHLQAKPNMSFHAVKESRCSRRVVPSKSRRITPVWTHEYCFNKQHTADRLKTIETGLNLRSRLLALKYCRPLDVRLERLSKKQIAAILPLSKVSLIDLTNDLENFSRPVKVARKSTGSQPLSNGTHVSNGDPLDVSNPVEVIELSSDDDDLLCKSNFFNQKNGLSHCLSKDGTCSGCPKTSIPSLISAIVNPFTIVDSTFSLLRVLSNYLQHRIATLKSRITSPQKPVRSSEISSCRQLKRKGLRAESRPEAPIKTRAAIQCYQHFATKIHSLPRDLKKPCEKTFNENSCVDCGKVASAEPSKKTRFDSGPKPAKTRPPKTKKFNKRFTTLTKYECKQIRNSSYLSVYIPGQESTLSDTHYIYSTEKRYTRGTRKKWLEEERKQLTSWKLRSRQVLDSRHKFRRILVPNTSIH